MAKLIAGLDIGNGYVKGSAAVLDTNTVTNIDIPSGVAYLTSTHDMKTPVDEIPGVIADIYNNMDVSFESPLVVDQNGKLDHNRRIFGSRGIQSGNVVEEFDVYANISKANQDLSFMLTFGCLAGCALQDYWNQNKKLPTEPLKVDVEVLALALPITEYKNYRKQYAESYKGATHIVTFHNFDTPVYVELKIKNVQVIAEGASAHYAIKDKGEPFMEAMLADIRSMGEPLEGITAADVLAAENTIGIDIGEGTVNFPVFQNGNFDPDISATYSKGYGQVLNQALSRLQEMGFPFNSRKALQAFLNKTPTAMTRNKYHSVQQVVDEEISAFILEIGMQFSKVMQRVGAFNEVVYVYGGGASPLKSELYPLLIEKCKGFGNGELSCPILYLDSRYSRFLNREGLYVLATKVSGAGGKKKTS